MSLRYSVKSVTTGIVNRLNQDEQVNSVGVLVVSDQKQHICVIDEFEKKAIDAFEPNERFQIFGTEDGEAILREEPFEEGKRYAVRVENVNIPTKDKKELIKNLQIKGIISGKVKLYRVWTGISKEFEHTGAIYQGHGIHSAEVLDLQEHLCTVNSDYTYAMDIVTDESFRILKRNEYNHIIDDYKLQEDERHVISISPIVTNNPVKILSLKNKYKKDKKKSDF